MMNTDFRSELKTQLDNNTAAFETAAKAIDVAIVDIKPTPERWSLAECVEHVYAVEKGIVRLLFLLGQGNEGANDRFAETVPYEKMQKAMQNRNRYWEAPDFVQPKGTRGDWNTLLQKIIAQRQQLSEALNTPQGLPFGTATAPHPYMGELTMLDWLHLLIEHNKRHLLQMQEITEAISAT
ncbi:MAG: DinB family protein [Sphingobacteriales bacterium]|nr:DinB family protein [Sphingobacteriales bacterium]